MHFPSLVHIVGLGVNLSSFCGGYLWVAFVRVSLRFGSLLKPNICLLLNQLPQSELLEMMFHFLWTILFIFGLQGL